MHARLRARKLNPQRRALPWLQGGRGRGQVAGRLCCECPRCLVRPLQHKRGWWPNVARGGAFSPQAPLQKLVEGFRACNLKLTLLQIRKAISSSTVSQFRCLGSSFEFRRTCNEQQTVYNRVKSYQCMRIQQPVTW